MGMQNEEEEKHKTHTAEMNQSEPYQTKPNQSECEPNMIRKNRYISVSNAVFQFIDRKSGKTNFLFEFSTTAAATDTIAPQQKQYGRTTTISAHRKT